MEKWDGRFRRLVSPAQVKQIAGRAGRFASKHYSGIVTAYAFSSLPPSIYIYICVCVHAAINVCRMCEEDLKYVRVCLEGTSEYQRFGWAPDENDYALLLEEFGREYSGLVGLVEGLQHIFLEEHRDGVLDERVFLCDHRDSLETLKMVHSVATQQRKQPPPLALTDLLRLMRAPVEHEDTTFCAMFRYFIEHLQRDKPCPLPEITISEDVIEQKGPADEILQGALAGAESVHRALELYTWLSLRWPGIFAESATKERDRYASMIDSMLAKGVVHPRCKNKKTA